MNIEPLNSMEQQSVNRELFNLYSIQQCGQSARSESNSVMQYGGYVGKLPGYSLLLLSYLFTIIAF